ncbi:hypothetical protein T09_7862 [Trichinella sp. T9]|nr:hypothetical protein T09_7862 [Trichinella sp. T9]
MPLLNRRNCRLYSNFPKQEKVLIVRLSGGRTVIVIGLTSLLIVNIGFRPALNWQHYVLPAIRLFYNNISLLSHSYADIGYCYCKITEY